ncbi:XdhC family protein [Aquibacillus rhizosphaerae]|uniref:XdhC family protein n=1 Tax=Aquibacillus rhizosphaerae TaxID=3051431 RepID=A0ABT7L565_9BACI|nr:XdhC/CoxI family protein [Aquibacillus sp. LR5S19]MDL4841008.1 XdhC family protein [Aquibacillus sp. LR5S19]
MEDIHALLDEISISSDIAILATIIHVDGSAYKKEGAMMLFQADGSQVGMLSAGCLEEDLAARIEHHGLGKRPEIIIYDMRGYNEISWGEGSGCNGVIHVLVEPLNESLRRQLKELHYHLKNRQAVTMIKQLPNENNDNKTIFLTESQQVFGNWEYNKHSLSKQLKDYYKSGKNGILYFPILSKQVYVHCFKPKPRLVIFGAGKDAMPLATFASRTGFSVVVADWRPALCNSSHFPDADEHIIGFPDELISKIPFTSNDYVVIMTHNFLKDKSLLSYLTDIDLVYLGVLGSARRTKRLLGGKDLPTHITSPIGLSINAEGPEEIAISVVAELIQLSKKPHTKGVKLCETI